MSRDNRVPAPAVWGNVVRPADNPIRFMTSAMAAGNTSLSQPRVYLETYGCQMNIADSQTVTAILRRAGYTTTDNAGEADVILLNTCAIREHAEERVLGRLSDLARLKSAHPERKLGLLGCMAQHNRAPQGRAAPSEAGLARMHGATQSRGFDRKSAVA